MSEPRSLPARPDLRHLRAEAKARRRAGEFATLAHAQLAVAREYGFASWPRLKFHVEAATQDVAQRAAALVQSACSSDVRRARALLTADPALAGHDLACACVSGEASAVQQMLTRAPELVNTPTGPLQHAPILYACFSRLIRGMPERAAGIRQVVRMLLERGADPNASFRHGDWLQVALYGAAGVAGDVELTRMLLDAGADPNDADGAHTVGEVLYHACEFTDPTCAQLVIDAGTDRDVVDYCLGRALNFPNAAMVEMFCAHGARASADNLHQAIMRRRPVETVQALLNAGAPLDAPDGRGITPLRWATRWGLRDVAELLIARGADTSSVTEADRALGAFLRRGGTVATDVDLDAMLSMAIEGGDLSLTRRLLDAGASPDGTPGDEIRPLGQACWRGYVPIVRELVTRGAQLTYPDGSPVGAALHGSRHCTHPEGGPTMRTIEETDKAAYAEVLRVLLDAGAPFPETPIDGTQIVTLFAELGVPLPV